MVFICLFKFKQHTVNILVFSSLLIFFQPICLFDTETRKKKHCSKRIKISRFSGVVKYLSITHVRKNVRIFGKHTNIYFKDFISF